MTHDRNNDAKDSSAIDIGVAGAPRHAAFPSAGALRAYAGMAGSMSALINETIKPTRAALASSGLRTSVLHATQTAELFQAKALPQIASLRQTMAPVLAQIVDVGRATNVTLAPTVESLHRTHRALTATAISNITMSPGLQEQFQSLAKLSLPPLSWDAVAAASALADDLGIADECTAFTEEDDSTAKFLQRLFASSAASVGDGAVRIAPAGVGLLVMLTHCVILLLLTGDTEESHVFGTVLYGLWSAKSDVPPAVNWTRSQLDRRRNESGG